MTVADATLGATLAGRWGQDMGAVVAAGGPVRPGRGVAPPPVVVAAWTAAGVAVATGSVSSVVAWLEGPDAVGRTFGGFLGLTVPFAIIGGVLASRLPRNAIGWLFLTIAAVAGLGQSADRYAERGLVVAPGSLPGAREAALVSDLLWFVPLVLLLTWVVLLFPDGRPPSPRWRPVVVLPGVALVVTVGTLALVGWDARGASFTGAPEPPFPAWAAVVAGGGAVVLLGSVLASAAGLVVRVRRSRGVERAQLRWFLAGNAAALAGVVLLFVLPTSLLQATLTSAGIAALPVAAATAILRYRLYDLDLVVNRSLVWLVLTGLVVLAYLGVAASVALLVGQRLSSLVAVLTAVVVTASFGPARQAVQRLVDRLTFGDRVDPYRVLADLGERLDATGPSEAGIRDAAATLARSFRLRSVTVHRLRADGTEEVLASVGAAETPDHLEVLRHAGAPVGSLVVGGRPAGDPVTDRDRALLEQVGRHLATAVHAVTLTRELRASHEALVRAREDERRQLRNDVHDGLGPSLASIAAGVEAARYGVDAATDADTVALLDRTLLETERAIAAARALARGLRPPTLDELGLLGAVRERCAALLGARCHLEVDGDLADLPAAVEVTALLVLEEAVTNVARHAAADRCDVRIEVVGTDDDARVVLEVCDDGVGIADAAPAGVGLGSMRRRVEHLGGSFELATGAGGGTRLVASLPLAGPG